MVLNTVDNFEGRLDFVGFLPFRDFVVPEEKDALDALQCCRHLVFRIAKQVDASLDLSSLSNVDDAQLWSVARRLVYGL
jgi:hypothetical protein